MSFARDRSSSRSAPQPTESNSEIAPKSRPRVDLQPRLSQKQPQDLVRNAAGNAGRCVIWSGLNGTDRRACPALAVSPRLTPAHAQGKEQSRDAAGGGRTSGVVEQLRAGHEGALACGSKQPFLEPAAAHVHTTEGLSICVAGWANGSMDLLSSRVRPMQRHTKSNRPTMVITHDLRVCTPIELRDLSVCFVRLWSCFRV